MNFTDKSHNLLFYPGLFAVVAWPFLSFLSSPINNLEASYFQLALIFSAFFLVSLISCEIVKRIFKLDSLIMLILFAFLYISFLYYHDYAVIFSNIVKKTQGIFPLQRIYLFGIYLVFGCILLFYASRFKAFRLASLTFIFVVFLFSLGEFLSLSYINHSSTKRTSTILENKNKKNELYSFEFKIKPNIYFLILDAFPRHDILLSKRDNSAFLEFFKKKGFLVADQAYSNYSNSPPSFSSTFEMAYVKNEDIVRHDVLSPQKEVFTILKNNNYDIISVPSPYAAFSGKNVANKVIYKNNILGSLLSDTSQEFLRRSVLRDYLQGVFGKYLYFSTLEIEKVLALKGPRPLFVFIHFMHFHDYVFDNTCNIGIPKRDIHYQVGKVVGANIGDIKGNSACLENLVEKIVNLIVLKDPQAIILVQSDHGPWYWQYGFPRREDFDKGFGIFSAIRLANVNTPTRIQEYLKDSPSPVNDFRIIFALLAGKEPDLLPYKAFHWAEGQTADVTKFRYKEE